MSSIGAPARSGSDPGAATCTAWRYATAVKACEGVEIHMAMCLEQAAIRLYAQPCSNMRHLNMGIAGPDCTTTYV